MTTMDRPNRNRAWHALSLCLLMLVACQQSLEDRLANARLQQEIGSWQESVATLQEILNQHPDHPEANLLLGTAQVSLGQPALAIWPLEVAGRDAEQADAADLVLGAAYLRLDQTDAARGAADRVLARNSDDPMMRRGAITIRASAHLRTRDWDAALEDIDRMLADDPEDVDGLALKAQALVGAERIDEAEASLRQIWDSPTHGRTGAAARAGISLARLELYHREDIPAAEKVVEDLLDRFPQNRGVRGFVVSFLEQNDRGEVATRLLRESLERDPGDLELRGQLAGHLQSQGESREAEKLLVEATELFDSPQAWLTLSDFYQKGGRPEEALAAFERTLELLPGTTDVLRFQYAGLLADAADFDRAEGMAREIEGDAYRNITLGRIAFLRGRPKEALRHFDAGLREWPNNTGARYLAGKAAIADGDVDRGLEELREALRAGTAETDAGLELGLIYLNLGRPETTISVMGMLLNDREFAQSPRASSAVLLLARAQWAVGNKDGARELLDRLERLEGSPLRAAVERAQFVAQEEGPAAGAESLEGADLDLTDPAHESALRLACEYWIASGKAGQAVARVDAALAAHPEEPAFHDLRGRVLGNVGRGDEAGAAFERAVGLDPGYAPALEGQGSLRLAAGDLAGARDLFERAGRANPENSSYPYRTAQMEMALGRMDAAEAQLVETLRRDPVHAHASNDLAWILAERGQGLDRALRLAKRASGAEPSAGVLDTLGWVHYRRGEHAQAVAAFERARALDAASGSIAYRLGLALVETGEKDRAAELFRQALAAGPFPEAEAASAQLARLEGGTS